MPPTVEDRLLDIFEAITKIENPRSAILASPLACAALPL